MALLMLTLLVAVFFQQAHPMLALHHLQQDVVKWMGDAARALEAGRR